MNAPLKHIPSITVFTSDNAPLTKRFTLQPNGTIKKDTLATLYAGRAEPVAAPTAQALASILDQLAPLQAIATGLPKAGRAVSIGTRTNATQGQATRSLQHFGFPSGSGWLLWDYDAKTMPPDVAQRIADLGGPLEAFFHIWPEARQGSYVIRPSSSDGVTAPGCPTIESAGLHGFFLVADVSQAKATLETLEQRAWANGLAWIALSKSGGRLRRSIVDTSVGSPERLVFEAGPILTHPVTRTPRQTIVQDGSGPLLAPALPLDLLTTATQAEGKAFEAIAPKAEKVEREYIDTRARDISKRTGKSLPDAIKAVRDSLSRNGATLTDDYLLQLKSGAMVRVGDLLDQPEKNHRLSMPDPIEGLEYGPDKATLFTKPRAGHPEDKPRLVSHAHGSTTVYRFARYETPPQDDHQHPPVWPAPTGDRETALGKTRAHIAKWAEKSRVAATAVRDVADRYGELDELLEPKERAKAQMAIRRAVKDAMGLDYLPTASWRKGDTSLRHMVTGAQGVGKTFALVGGRMDGRDHRGALHEGYGLVSVFYSSDHTQSAQAFSDYQVGYRPKTDPIGIQALGRTAQHPTDPTKTACELGKQTRKAAAKGVNIQKAFCRECPFASGCAYLERVRDIEAATKSPQGAVVFGVHEHAFTKMAGVDRADRHIFDERVRAFKEATYSIAIDDWHRDLSEYLDWTGQSAGQTADALADSLTIKRVRTEIGRAVTERPADALQAIKEALQPLTPKGGSVSDFLRQTVGKLQQFNADRLQERIAGEIKAFSFSVADGRRGASLESRLDKQLDAADENHVRNLAKIMQAVALDIDQDHFPHLTTVYVTQMNKAQRIAALVVEKTTIPENAPLLHLDGTGEGEIANAWLGPMVRHHFPVERLTKSAIMVDGHHFSNSALTGEGYKGAPYYPERAAVVRAKLRRIIDRTPNAFLAAPKRAIELLGETSAKVSLWYGALRGSNLAKDCETAIIVGRNLPSVGEVEAKARAIAAALNRPFTPIPSGGPTGTLWPRRDEYIRLADGTTYPINVEYHPDPTAQMVVRQIRDAEAAQALDRVRAQYQTRSFIIMGACIPDLTFTEVKAWRNMAEGGTRMERCIEQHGVIPLSPAEAFNIAPHFWGSLSTAKKDKEIQTVKAGMSGNLWSGQMVLNRYLIHDDPTKESACLVAYKRLTKGRGGNTSEHHAIVIGRPSQARLILERVTGALADFRVVDYNEAAHAMDLAEHHAARIAAQVQDMPPENITPLPRPVAKPAPVRPPLRVASGAGPPFPD